ncbi:unnamed protein product [Blepharisma stoltei]|uniref:Cyclic nucleotide-binding domain-containing protein n=1 Tax=Blepharisma stoltei TaxID=1481888 RepID=A0AAU9K9J5_9CILI|nr:unnamed protein product [Blepharisma stoltei]
MQKSQRLISVLIKRHNTRVTPQLLPISPISDDCDETNINSELSNTKRFLFDSKPQKDEEKPIRVRDIPVVNRKYLDVWKRVRIKIKSKLLLKDLKNELNLYGTSNPIAEEMKGFRRAGTKGFKNQDTSFSISIDESTSQQEYVPVFILHPNGRFKGYWNIILMFLLLYTAIVMPFEMSFLNETKGDEWWWTDVCLNILFFTDFVINCFTAFYDEDSLLVTGQAKILKNYLKGWMIIDIASFFPFDFIISDNSENNNDGAASGGGMKNLIRLLQVPKLYRLLRIIRIFKMLTHCKRSEMVDKIQEFLGLKQGITKLSTFLFSIFICIHVISCLFYYSAKLEGFYYGTWVVKWGYLDDDVVTMYITCIYWAVTTLSTVGYGDITPTTNFEIIFALCWMMFGLCFYSFTIGNISALLTGIDSKEMQLTKKLSAIDEFSKEANLPKSLKTKLRDALKYSTEKNGFSWVDKKTIFSELPKQLRYEIALAMHQGAANSLSFFSDKDPVFVSAIVPFLQHVFVKADDFIYKEGEYSDEIYFITKGKVCFVHGPGHMVYNSINSGEYFGDIGVINDTPRKYSAKAIVDCDILTMNNQLITYIREVFPEIWSEIELEAKEKEEYIDAAKNQVIEFMKLEENGEIDQPRKRLKTVINHKIKEKRGIYEKVEGKDVAEIVEETKNGIEELKRDMERTSNIIIELLKLMSHENGSLNILNMYLNSPKREEDTQNEAMESKITKRTS